jgi:hypothetical protein
VTHRVKTFALDGSTAWNGVEERAAAKLRVTPEELEARCGITFERGHDELDFDRRAGVVLPSGQRVVLQWYERAPEPRGVVVYVDRAEAVATALDQTLAVLGLTTTEVLWIPESAPPAG